MIWVRFFIVIFCLTWLPGSAQADLSSAPGDYKLRVKIGPSFNIQDWQNQVRVGGEFAYELGYALGLDMLVLLGISEKFRFQMIPSLRYDYLYLGPASFYGALGMGYGRFHAQDSLDLRFGTGVVLPLGKGYELNSDVNMYVSPVGPPGTPVTMEWLLGFGLHFN